MATGIDQHAAKSYIKYSGGIIRFQIMPEEVRDSKSANYVNTDIVGRSHPIKGYSSSGPRTLSFSIKFYKFKEEDNPLQEANRLRALLYPDYSSGIFPPPLCQVKIGQIKMQGVAISADISYRYPWDESVSPIFVEVSLTFEETGRKPFSFQEVMNGSDMSYVEI